MDLSPIVPSSVVASSPVMYLPQPIQNVFASAQYCYLATCVGDSPHLSLMHFSHTDDPELGNIIVLSTRYVDHASHRRTRRRVREFQC